MLNVLAGTTESHRRGLEQAFSELFKARVEFSTLEHFNLIPQFLIELRDMKANHGDGSKFFSVEELRIAFSALDLLLGDKTIEDFSAKDIILWPVAAQSLKFDRIEIKTHPSSPQFSLRALDRRQAIEATLVLQQKPDRYRPSYYIDTISPIEFRYGDFRANGQLNLSGHQGPMLQNLVIGTIGEFKNFEILTLELKPNHLPMGHSGYWRSHESCGQLTLEIERGNIILKIFSAQKPEQDFMLKFPILEDLPVQQLPLQNSVDRVRTCQPA
jgi:hypothetical protein